MTVSVFELFKIGIGPSSSHTVGPMHAGLAFAEALIEQGHAEALCASQGDDHGGDALAEVITPRLGAISIILYGSLAATGQGHGTLGAVLAGLAGMRPETVDPEEMAQTLTKIAETGLLTLGGDTSLPVRCGYEDIILRPGVQRTIHTNAVTFVAVGADGTHLHKQTYYSVGGGFIRTKDSVPQTKELVGEFCFDSGAQLLEIAESHEISIAEVQRRCELSCRTEEEIAAGLAAIHAAMKDCAEAGWQAHGVLPGGLNVKRRAGSWYDSLHAEDPDRQAHFAEEWVNLVALAVNEENAAGGRVVTAPTNGAAGIIPAVLHYALHYTEQGKTDRTDTAARFLLAAGAIGSLYKERASISGAEVGCQGEVGSASSMAAAGLAEILGGTPAQVENAAEIAMEHSLGLTCDPIAGLVQIPCIERNAISAGKAINAARMALRGDGTHHVTLDEVIETMRVTGKDMSSKYKETAGGGLAVLVSVAVPEC